MFFDTYKRLCINADKTPNGVAKELGFPSSSVTQWKKGSTPRPAALRKIADFFGVSVDDFLTGEETKKEPVPISENELDLHLIELLTSLTPDEMRQVDAFVQGLLAARKA